MTDFRRVKDWIELRLMADLPAPVTAMVLTYNEAPNIEACLEHLNWCDEIVLVDSFSTDDTIPRARSVCPRVRVLQNAFQDFGQQRNWALDHAQPRNPWILFMDADERCTESCAVAIRQAVQQPGSYVGFYLCYRNLFLGKWIRRSTLYPSWQVRLLQLGQVRFQREGHGQREVTDGELGYIPEPYDHYGFSKGVSHWVDRHNRYASEEVELIRRARREPLALRDLFGRDPIRRRRCLKRISARSSFRPLVVFFYLYVLRGGFLDGRPGLLFALLRLAYELILHVKLAESGTLAQEAELPTRERDEAARCEVDRAPPQHANGDQGR